MFGSRIEEQTLSKDVQMVGHHDYDHYDDPHPLTSIFHASMGWIVRLRSGEPVAASGQFLQSDACPNANHSESEAAVFYVQSA